MFHVYLCYAALSVPCSIMGTCRQKADLLALLCVAFLVFLSLSHPVWYSIVLIPDLCLPL